MQAPSMSTRQDGIQVFLTKMPNNDSTTNTTNSNKNKQSNKNNKTKGYIATSYVQGLCESIRNLCGKSGMNTYFKGNRTMKNMLVSPKDKDPIQQISAVLH